MKFNLGSGVKAGWGFMRILKIGFLSLFLIYLLISISLTAYKERDLIVVVKELGEEFYNPIQTAQDVSLEMQNGEFNGIWDSLFKYWGFYYSLYILYLWLKILSWLAGASPLSNNSETFKNILLSVTFFLFIQLLYFSLVLKESPNQLFIAFKDIFQGLVSIFTSYDFSSGSEELVDIEVKNTCNESICVV